MAINPPNYTQVPNVLLDAIGELTDAELRVALAICRQTFGWHKERDAISLSQLQDLTGRSRPMVSDGLKRLIARGWVERSPVQSRGGQSYAYRLVVEAIGADEADTPPDQVVALPTSSPAYQYPSLPVADHEPEPRLPHRNAKKREVVAQATSRQGYPQKKDLERKNPTPPKPPTETPPAGGGGGEKPIPRTAPPPGARYLVSEGFGPWAVEQFGHLPVEVLQADIARYRALGKQNGGIVNAWKVCPPGTPTPHSAPPPPPTSSTIISMADIDPQERTRWLRKLRAEGADRAAVIAAFLQEHPHVSARPPAPARAAAPARPRQ